LGRWQSSPGKYCVEIQDGNVQFTIQDETLTVGRRGKNILVVRRKAAADVAGSSPAPTHSSPGSRIPPESAARQSSPTDTEVLRRLADVNWEPGSSESDLYGCVAAPAALTGIPAAWQVIARGTGQLSRTG